MLATLESILLAHVLEHLDEAAGDEVFSSYLPYVRPEGRLIVVWSQERG